MELSPLAFQPNPLVYPAQPQFYTHMAQHLIGKG